jgi:hypothetical protein
MSMARSAVAWVITLCGLAAGACATSTERDDFNAFLQRIAADCKPLVIGSDDMGEAIVFNGLGAVPERYNLFLAKTQALYGGAISQQVYRDSVTSFVGAGSRNARSFDCIVAHLPPSAQGGQAPAK